MRWAGPAFAVASALDRSLSQPSGPARPIPAASVLILSMSTLPPVGVLALDAAGRWRGLCGPRRVVRLVAGEGAGLQGEGAASEALA